MADEEKRLFEKTESKEHTGRLSRLKAMAKNTEFDDILDIIFDILEAIADIVSFFDD